MKYIEEKINLKTEKRPLFIDLTDKINSAIKKHKIRQGFVNIYNMHTTSGIWINENEKGLLTDMEQFLLKLIPEDGPYIHDDFNIRKDIEPGERKNGWAHLRASLFSTSEKVPIKNSSLLLGKWQSIFFVEMDGPKERNIHLQLYDFSDVKKIRRKMPTSTINGGA